MNASDYARNIARLKEIEEMVKNPESSLDKIDSIIDESKRIKKECLEYVRGIKEKIARLDDDSIEECQPEAQLKIDVNDLPGVDLPGDGNNVDLSF